MTRERHLALIRRVRIASQKAGRTPEEIDELQVARVLEELEIEHVEFSGIIVDFPSCTEKISFTRPDPDTLAPPKADHPDAPGSSVIVDPSSEVGRKILGDVAPIRLGSTPYRPEAGPTTFWTPRIFAGTSRPIPPRLSR